MLAYPEDSNQLGNLARAQIFVVGILMQALKNQ